MSTLPHRDIDPQSQSELSRQTDHWPSASGTGIDAGSDLHLGAGVGAGGSIVPGGPDGPEPLPSLSDWVTDRPRLKWAIVVALLIVALISEFALRPRFEQPETWTSTVSVIDAKKANVLALTTASLSLSAAISAIPDDTGTPIAEQLSQLAGNLGIVLAVLYLEKYLLTILSFLALGILVPIACALFAIALAMHNNLSTSRTIRIAGLRILVVALISLFVVPASVWVTNRIDQTYQTSIERNAAEDAATAEDEQAATDEGENSGNFLDNLIDAASGLAKTVTDGIQSITEGLITQVNNLIEGAIVMIVTSCVIPILVLLVFLWLGHTLLGLDLSAPTDALMRRMRPVVHKGKATQLKK